MDFLENKKRCKICRKFFRPRSHAYRQRTCLKEECQKAWKKKYFRKWFKKNPGYFLSGKDAWGELRKEYMDDWLKRNPKYMSKWRKNHGEKLKKYVQKCRLVKKLLSSLDMKF